MIYPLILKEVKEIFRNRTTLIYFFLLFSVIAYSFYSAVDLYSKASVAAIGNPLYATGFEPVPGVFVPTFGGLFIIFSLIAPFLLIRSVGEEKKNNTLPLLVQLPYSLRSIFLTKLLAASMLILVSILFFVPLLFFWNFMGGHIPWSETILLMSGYSLYGLFVISVSFFSASIFRSNSQASIFSLAVIMFSWFVDFGKEMNIIPMLNSLSGWTTTKQLKVFESGILSLSSIFYFILLSSFLSSLAYYFFNINIRNRTKQIVTTFLICFLLFGLAVNVQLKKDISESRKNSFSAYETNFLKKLPAIDIEIYLEPTDGRFKDYKNDFLKKLELIKNNISVHFAKGRSLSENYGLFKYSINNKSQETYSNSAHEIFMVLEELSGLRIERSESDIRYAGYPLVVKERWSGYMFTIYLLIFPLMILFFFYWKNIFNRRRKNENWN